MGAFPAKVDRKDPSAELGRLRPRGREALLEPAGPASPPSCPRTCPGTASTAATKELARLWRVMTLRERRPYW